MDAAPVCERLLLPKKYRTRLIKRAHEEVGHQAVAKTLDRVRETYVWPYYNVGDLAVGDSVIVKSEERTTFFLSLGSRV